MSKTLKKRINGTVTDAGTVALIVYLFQEAGNITVGDETTEVNEGTVKFSLQLDNFAFCTADEMDCDNVSNRGGLVVCGFCCSVVLLCIGSLFSELYEQQ